MTTIDKAAIAWTIAIVAVGAGFAAIGIQPDSGTSPTTPPVMEQETAMESMPSKPIMAGWDRIESTQDPGIGHESHQLAVILPPSDKVYHGTIQYDTSEPVQLVTLHGPLSPGEDKGQPIWTPDGTTKFALTLVDQDKSRGTWKFAGNALALHTFNTEQFIADYKLDYKESTLSDTVMSGTIESIQDPGIGHESHSLAIIIPPSEKVHTGILSYSTSEPIQLVALNGPLAPGKTAPMIWTPDGSTNFALTFVDPKNNMGSWEFSGNALAVHTMNTRGFTTSYSVATTAKVMEKQMEEKQPMKEKPSMAGPQTVEVSIPAGTSVPGCETNNECYLPPSVSINAGDTVVWINDDTAAHTVTSGTATDGPDGKFDSSLIVGGGSFEYTFDTPGNYNYFCMVHPWMTGDVKVS